MQTSKQFDNNDITVFNALNICSVCGINIEKVNSNNNNNSQCWNCEKKVCIQCSTETFQEKIIDHFHDKLTFDNEEKLRYLFFDKIDNVCLTCFMEYVDDHVLKWVSCQNIVKNLLFRTVNQYN